VAAQESVFGPLLEALGDPEEHGGDAVARWRSEISRATARFLRGLRTGARSTAFVVLMAVALPAVACGQDKIPSAGSTATPPALSGEITVLAAASLTGAFNEIGRAFQGDHPGTKVTFSFDASSTLATQVNSGAPADVFASADEANLNNVVQAGNAADPKVFARNRLAVLVAKGNPKAVKGLADLGRPGTTFVLCAAEVPCGRYGAQVLERAGVTAKPKSYEVSVKGVVAKVVAGEVDAGIVYVTDVKAAGDKTEGVDIPDATNVIAAYPLAVLKQSRHPAVARAFKDYVLSPAGQHLLAAYGFMPG
jgi:molybdate transport system substrate-binding protein